MNQETTGQLIKELRKINNLSQSELALKLSVTPQAVSKWENGRGFPDIEMLNKLSEIFQVDIKELINGKLNKPSKGKNKIIVIVGIIITIVLLLGLIIYLNSKDTFKFSRLATDNSSFDIKGVVASDNNKQSIFISKIDYTNNEIDEKKYTIMECVLYETVSSTEKIISKCGDLNNYKGEDKNATSTLSELLKNVEFKIDNYTCSCKNKVCNNLYLKINALNTEKEVITYKIPLHIEEYCPN
ncbi:MAG: helix-turn-helix domain-containing protein [Bacilli bacterium]